MKFSNRLFDFKPASSFELCYPQGNGSLGVMDNGGIAHEVFNINDDTFWSGTGKAKHRSASGAFQTVRQLVLDNNLKDAESVLWHDFLGSFTEAYLPLGEIHLVRSAVDTSNYSRLLDLSTGIHTVYFGTTMQTSFVSYPAKVFSLSINAPITTVHRFSLESKVNNNVEVKLENEIATITLNAIAPSHVEPPYQNSPNPVIYDEANPGMKGQLKCKITSDGIISLDNNQVVVEGATSITLYATTTTSFKDKDLDKTTETILNNAVQKGFDDLQTEHIQDFNSLYSRCEIDLDGDDLGSDTTTIEILKKKSKHPSLAVLLFNFGRYLTISGSRKDSVCMNLQGIWNKDIRAPWSSNYTTNINTEMNYWGCEVVNLSECHLPMINQIRTIAKEGAITAKEQFGMSGWVCGQNSDFWGASDMVGQESGYNPSLFGLFVGGGGWLASHIWMHYEYSLDKKFLEENYDIIKESAKFYLDYLTKDPDSDNLIVCPSCSPENCYRIGALKFAINKNSTMDSTIVRQILSIVLKASKVLNKDSEFAQLCNDTLAKIYPFKIGKHGELLEWYDNYPEVFKHHRHISHLYALYPDNQISPMTTPELAKACAKTLKRRGDGGTGWSLAWKINMYARLFNGDMALKLINNQLTYINSSGSTRFKGGSYGSMLCAHPPFQIDGNFGAMSGIAEMLLQSHNVIHILPALPKKWPNGAFNGLVAKGKYIVSCTWRDGKVVSLNIKGNGVSVPVLVNGTTQTVPLNTIVHLQ